MKYFPVKCKTLCALAPMAGVSDRAFRELCASYGAAFTVSEMVSSRAIQFDNPKTMDLMVLSESPSPCGIQLFGDNPEVMAQAAQTALAFHPDFIDINMGCPAPKVNKSGGGASLMKDPALCGRIVRSVREAVTIPVSVKIRTGWDEAHINAVEVAAAAAQNGADFLTIHGRTRAQGYAPGIDKKTIALVKQSVSVPVIANGDITDCVSAQEMLSETGVDMLMVGRGALGSPWIFRTLDTYFSTGKILLEPSAEEKMAVLLKHIEKLCTYKGEYRGMKEARKHAAWYMKGLRGAASFRGELSSLETLAALKAVIDKVLLQN